MWRKLAGLKGNIMMSQYQIKEDQMNYVFLNLYQHFVCACVCVYTFQESIYTDPSVSKT